MKKRRKPKEPFRFLWITDPWSTLDHPKTRPCAWRKKRSPWAPKAIGAIFAASGGSATECFSMRARFFRFIRADRRKLSSSPHPPPQARRTSTAFITARTRPWISITSNRCSCSSWD